jgi:hypothetical protein
MLPRGAPPFQPSNGRAHHHAVTARNHSARCAQALRSNSHSARAPGTLPQRQPRGQASASAGAATAATTASVAISPSTQRATRIRGTARRCGAAGSSGRFMGAMLRSRP